MQAHNDEELCAYTMSWDLAMGMHGVGDKVKIVISTLSACTLTWSAYSH